MKKSKTEAEVAHGPASDPFTRQTLQGIEPLARNTPFDTNGFELGEWEVNSDTEGGYRRFCADGWLYSYSQGGWIRFQIVYNGIQLADWPVTPYRTHPE